MEFSKYKNTALLFLFYLFWPFGSFLVAGRYIYDKKYHIIILLFSALYGYSVYMYSGDVVLYNESFVVITTYSWLDFFTLITNRYSTIPYDLEYSVVIDQPDFYALILEFLVSRITDNSRWFFALISIIYTWLFLSFINMISKLLEIDELKKMNVFYLFIIFCIPFYVGVTGVRFWPALFIFLFFTVKLLIHEKKKYILYAAISLLFHFSFIVPVLLLPVFLLIKRIKYLTSILLLITIIMTISSNYSTKLQFFNQSSLIYNEKIEERTSSYIDESILEDRLDKVQSRNWYVNFNKNALTYALIILVLLLELRLIKVRHNVLSEKLRPYVLFSLIFSLLVFDLGSIARFNKIFQIMTLIYFANLLIINRLKLLKFSYVFNLLLIIHVLITFRAGFYTIDPYLLTFGSSITSFLFHSTISLSEFLIGH